MKFVEPRIFHVAQTTLDLDGVQAFLDELGVPDWNTDAPSDQEKLIELGGKLCYLSFTPSLNKNVTKVTEDNTKYIGNILKQHHGSVIEHGVDAYILYNVSRVFCYTPDTEILTKTGWKLIPSLGKSDYILTKNPTTRKCEWALPIRLLKFDYSGPIHWYESSQWKSPSFTPEHIQWGSLYDKRQFRGKKIKDIVKYAEKIPFKDLRYRRLVVDHSIELDSCDDPVTITIGDFTYNAEEFFFFLGVWVTDGYISKYRNAVNVTQIKPHSRKIIRSLMTKLFNDRLREYEQVFTVSDPELKKWLISTFNGRLKEEIRLYNLFNYSPRLLNRFYQGVLLGDGNTHKENKHEVVYCSFLDQAKDYQTIISMINRSSNIRVDDRRGNVRLLNNNLIINNLINYVISVHKKGESLIKKTHYKESRFVGKVFCPETSNGLVFVRREGMAFWCGNTHEVVRHRAGTAFSRSIR